MKKGINSIKQRKGQTELNVDAGEVLTVDEVAIFLRMKPNAIYNAIKHKVIPALKVGNKWRLSREAVLEALNDVRK